jgi:hypothetical protein
VIRGSHWEGRSGFDGRRPWQANRYRPRPRICRVRFFANSIALTDSVRSILHEPSSRSQNCEQGDSPAIDSRTPAHQSDTAARPLFNPPGSIISAQSEAIVGRAPAFQTVDTSQHASRPRSFAPHIQPTLPYTSKRRARSAIPRDASLPAAHLSNQHDALCHPSQRHHSRSHPRSIFMLDSASDTAP